MKNKILISTFLLLLFTVFLCSYSFATNNMLQSAGNAAKQTGNTLVNGTKNIINGAANIGNDMMNDIDGMDNNDTAAIYDTANDNYTAQRTATTNTGLFGMSSTMLTWLILGIIGAAIVGLVWYYGAQYEHRNYNND